MAHFMEILQMMSDDVKSITENSSQIQIFLFLLW